MMYRERKRAALAAAGTGIACEAGRGRQIYESALVPVAPPSGLKRRRRREEVYLIELMTQRERERERYVNSNSASSVPSVSFILRLGGEKLWLGLGCLGAAVVF